MYIGTASWLELDGYASSDDAVRWRKTSGQVFLPRRKASGQVLLQTPAVVESEGIRRLDYFRRYILSICIRHTDDVEHKRSESQGALSRRF